MFKTERELSDDPNNSKRQHAVLKLRANERLFADDDAFDWIYPEGVGAKSRKHWSPLAIARKAARFLAEPNKSVLDVGSGAGKFCLIGAYDNPDTVFCGVEQRPELVDCAENAKAYLELPNVHFVSANMTQVNFGEFDYFYFYNSFYENIDSEDAIDDNIFTSYSLYIYYTRYLHAELEKKPSGTRLVTYHSIGEEVPRSFRLAYSSPDMLLRMWVKQ